MIVEGRLDPSEDDDVAADAGSPPQASTAAVDLLFGQDRGFVLCVGNLPILTERHRSGTCATRRPNQCCWQASKSGLPSLSAYLILHVPVGMGHHPRKVPHQRAGPRAVGVYERQVARIGLRGHSESAPRATPK